MHFWKQLQLQSGFSEKKASRNLNKVSAKIRFSYITNIFSVSVFLWVLTVLIFFCGVGSFFTVLQEL